MSKSHDIVALEAVLVVTGGVEVEEKSGGEQADRASGITAAIACGACLSARGKTSPRGAPLRGPSPAGGPLPQEIGDPQEIIREDRRAHEHLEPLAPLE